MTEGIVNIRGKEYQTVAYRVQRFRESHPEWSLLTDIISVDDDRVVMKAAILDPEGRIIATGHAEEVRASRNINRTSALENAETSAIGRCLAALGLGGTEFATANEVQGAIQQQEDRTGEYVAKVIETLKANDPIAMALFEASIGQDAWRAMFNGTSQLSSEQKSKVRESCQRGNAMLNEYAQGLEGAASDDAKLGAKELWDELSKDAKRIVWNRIGEEAREFVRELKDIEP